MRMSSYVIPSTLALLFAFCGSGMAAKPKKTLEDNLCAREFSSVDKAFAEALEDLQRNGATPQRCTSWQREIGVLKTASDVFARCLEGEPRDQAIAQMDGSITGLKSMMQEGRCDL